MIQKDPTAHPVIKGTGGVRKMRFSLSNTGKSGGIRVIYSDFPERGKVLLIKVYSKHEQEDLTESEIKTIKRLSQEPT
ncbi:MAG: type II toxin-antitoxin system RelE/ParE family toxin [Defluviitaleaceae bacterium]|nr:type II toxin-antitoxin system RelE/ParE family toxin [Defluviitaleaceae bacterium]